MVQVEIHIQPELGLHVPRPWGMCDNAQFRSGLLINRGIPTKSGGNAKANHRRTAGVRKIVIKKSDLY